MKSNFFILLFLLLGISLTAQNTLDINSAPTNKPMSSYLNGIGRNHFRAFTKEGQVVGSSNVTKYENKFMQKVEIVGNIKNNFANQGRSVYRFGHNISDGNNLSYSIFSSDVHQPGWHWATKYESGGDPATVEANSPHSDVLGAGVHRYFFKHEENRNVDLVPNFQDEALNLNSQNATTKVVEFTTNTAGYALEYKIDVGVGVGLNSTGGLYVDHLNSSGTVIKTDPIAVFNSPDPAKLQSDYVQTRVKAEIGTVKLKFRVAGTGSGVTRTYGWYVRPAITTTPISTTTSSSTYFDARDILHVHYSFYSKVTVGKGGKGRLKIEFFNDGGIIQNTSKTYETKANPVNEKQEEYVQWLITPPQGTKTVKFSVEQVQNYGGYVTASDLNFSELLDKYSGYTVTVNYPNVVGDLIGENNGTPKLCPQSYTKTLTDSEVEWTLSDDDVAMLKPTFSSSYEVLQVGGPRIVTGTKIPWGIMEVDFRIKATNSDAIGYCGYILSVNQPNDLGEVDDQMIARTSKDIYLKLASPLYAGLDSLAIRQSHAISVPEVHHPEIFPSSSGKDMNEVYNLTPVTYDPITNLPLPILRAKHYLSIGYDDIDYYLQEASLLKSDLAIVANIGTGFPEEVEGLLAYLDAKKQRDPSFPKVAYLELGSELMGYWNKGSDHTSTPTQLGKYCLPFAKRIKQNLIFKTTRPVKVATNSTYNFTLEFQGSNLELSSIPTRIDEWLTAMTDGNELLVDYLNIHNYPCNKLATTAFDSDKVKNLLAVNDVLRTGAIQNVA
jgi:hypothetical protein